MASIPAQDFVAENEIGQLIRRGFELNRVVKLSFGFGGPSRVWLAKDADWERAELKKMREQASAVCGE